MKKLCQLILISLVCLGGSSANAFFFLTMSAKKFERVLFKASPVLARHLSNYNRGPSFNEVKRLGSEILPGVAMLKFEYAQKKVSFPDTDLFSEAIYHTILQKEPSWKEHLTKISIKPDADSKYKNVVHCAVGVLGEDSEDNGEAILLVVDTELGPWNPTVLPFDIWRHLLKEGSVVMSTFGQDINAKEFSAVQKRIAQVTLPRAILERAKHASTLCWNDDVPNVD